MPSALFEIYQKNFEKTLKRLTEMLDLYQKQPKEAQSITLKEAELNISEMERAISQMEFEVIIEKIPDNKKKLNKIIEANKNIVKQYKREIQDLKYKEQSILNKKNLAHIPSSKKNKKNTELNLLKNKDNTKINNFMTDDEDIALFINKNNMNNNINGNNGSINLFNNDNIRDEINLNKDVEIKRINDFGNNSENIVINNTNDLDFFSNFGINSNPSNNINLKKKKENSRNIKNIDDKDSQDNKYKKNKNNIITKIFGVIANIINLLITIIIYILKDIIYKRSIQLKNYLHRKYGYTNAMRIMVALIVISFIFIYSLFVILFSSKAKIQENNINKINLIKNNTNETIINNDKIIEKNLINDTNINMDKSNLINENNTISSNISKSDGNITIDKT
jgi:hypothetical protein